MNQLVGFPSLVTGGTPIHFTGIGWPTAFIRFYSVRFTLSEWIEPILSALQIRKKADRKWIQKPIRFYLL